MQTALPHSKVIQDDRKNQKRICVILFAVFLVAMLGTMFIPVHPYSYSKTIIERTRDENGKLKQQKIEKLYEGNATLTDIIWRSKTEEGGFVAKELEEQIRTVMEKRDPYGIRMQAWLEDWLNSVKDQYDCIWKC